MTYRLCKAKGHNKRSCPPAKGSISTVVIAASASVPRAGSGRGRGTGSTPFAAAASSSCGSIIISGRGRGRGSAPPIGSLNMPYVGSTCAFRRGRARGK